MRGSGLRWLRWPALAVVVLGTAALLFWPAADFLGAHDARGLSGKQRIQEAAKARDAARGRMVQLATVMLGLGAYVFTVRNFQLALDQSRRQAEATNRTLEQNEAAQITDRFARAIELLGSEAIDARLGAIYSLERIARDSERDHPTVMEVLTAFVRRTSTTTAAGASRQDLWAALSVIARRRFEHDRGRLVLRDSLLPEAELTEAALAGADLRGIRLAEATLTRAELAAADLTDGVLDGARLDGADLTGADLTRVSASGARLTDATLTDAALNGARLDGGALTGARLQNVHALRCALSGADLTGADLTGADLSEADLNDARLPNAVLRNVTLTRGRLARADLSGADLRDVDLSRAVLSRARLQGANLSGARLDETNLSGATLAGAHLAGVDLTQVVGVSDLDLTDAIADDATRLTAGWHADPATGRVTRLDQR
ncbi:pentapeptide repeat-containing protein [Thermomonospora umbrina]|uniref:Uncharacterized protein YjbI with pentapeptide repeats n=1 Tax=Thermomonospora umbrina TaxID=111806 RepID=A0A3D9SI92_9ACTN|nr:pentapeptide repeat-containing protein [Thermomonospora umbrina]REE95622.1 uncharacterized protein YjbI with pentapeptide repeats [Thermomonospora umbrina]